MEPGGSVRIVSGFAVFESEPHTFSLSPAMSVVKPRSAGVTYPLRDKFFYSSHIGRQDMVDVDSCSIKFDCRFPELRDIEFLLDWMRPAHARAHQST